MGKVGVSLAGGCGFGFRNQVLELVVCVLEGAASGLRSVGLMWL